MKYLLTIIVCLFFMGCGTRIGETTDTNVSAVIVKINQNEDAMVQNGKYKAPALGNTALFKNTSNNMYFTFTACGNCIEYDGHYCYAVNLNDAWVYGHLVGDTVNFEYVNRSRYFTIKK